VDGNAYTAALVQSLVNLIVGIAGPTVVLILLVTFQPQIRELLGRVSEAEGFGVKAKFDPRKAEAAVESAEGSDFGVGVNPEFAYEPLSKSLADLARSEPRFAVLTAYEEVENVLKRRLAEAEEGRYEYLSGYRLINVAEKRGHTSPETAAAIRELFSLRNNAEYGEGEEITRAKAHDYLVLCDRVILTIGMWRKR
jgi:hypothetical protein